MSSNSLDQSLFVSGAANKEDAWHGSKAFCLELRGAAAYGKNRMGILFRGAAYHLSRLANAFLGDCTGIDDIEIARIGKLSRDIAERSKRFGQRLTFILVYATAERDDTDFT